MYGTIWPHDNQEACIEPSLTNELFSTSTRKHFIHGWYHDLPMKVMHVVLKNIDGLL